jgi:ribosome-associated translation inhibitor RaiA
MTGTSTPLAVRLRMRWLDFSPALHFYATRRIETALRRFADRVRSVEAVIADANGPRRGPDDKICEIELFLHPTGSIKVSDAADDPYLAVDRATRRLRALVRARLGRHAHRERTREPQIA